MTKTEMLRHLEEEFGPAAARQAATATRGETAAILEGHRKDRFLSDLARARAAQVRLFGGRVQEAG